jgi:hypothetical protein
MQGKIICDYVAYLYIIKSVSTVNKYKDKHGMESSEDRIWKVHAFHTRYHVAFREIL